MAPGGSSLAGGGLAGTVGVDTLLAVEAPPGDHAATRGKLYCPPGGRLTGEGGLSCDVTLPGVDGLTGDVILVGAVNLVSGVSLKGNVTLDGDVKLAGVVLLTVDDVILLLLLGDVTLTDDGVWISPDVSVSLNGKVTLVGDVLCDVTLSDDVTPAPGCDSMKTARL